MRQYQDFIRKLADCAAACQHCEVCAEACRACEKAREQYLG